MKLSGIIASTEIEAELIIERLQDKESLSIQGKPFYKGILKDTEAVVCICGIGKANAAQGATLLLERFMANFIYNIGVGGAYPSSQLSIGDIAIAEKEIYGDEGLTAETEYRRQKTEVRGKNRISFYTMDKLGLPLATINGVNYYNEFPMFIPPNLNNVKKGNFVTVSSCTGILEKAMQIEKRFDAICENMEGAAIAHICALSRIQAAEIRGISNIVEDRAAAPLNKADIIKAAENVQRFFLETINFA